MIRVLFILFLSVLNSAIVFSQITSEEIIINNYEIQLPGTLTYSSETAPLLIWVHGSGNVDRNGNQAGMPVGANYIQQVREKLTASGLAFFSYDKRTANPKNIGFMQQNGVLIGDFVDDVKEVINHFKNRKKFSSITLIGHSQGSLISMLASANVDKVISLAGPAETIDKTIIRQVSGQSKELGELCISYFKQLKDSGEIKTVDPRLITLFAKPNQPFFKSWIEKDPVKIIENLSKPILIVNGDKDLQVPSSEAKALHEANTTSQLVNIKNMNHVLKEIEKSEDNLASYRNPTFAISKELIVMITRFVKE